MRLRALALAAGLVAAHSAANAWFFFIIPTGAIQSAIQGNHCVSSTAKEGDKIMADGREWIIKSTSGMSRRCTNPNLPVIAKVEPQLTQKELETQTQVCLPHGTDVGTTNTLPMLGRVQVVALGPSTDCSDQAKPISALVVPIPIQ